MDNATKQVILNLLESSSSSDYSDDDSIFEEFFFNVLSSDDFEEEDEDNDEISDFVDIIEEYSEDDFKSHLKLKRSTVEFLISKYTQSDIYKTLQQEDKPKIEARTEILLYLWYMSHTITFEQLGNLFGISKPSVWAAVELVRNWLVSQGYVYIKWPQGDVVAENSQKFESKNNLPGIIGAIDATHITISTPRWNKEKYFNRKKNFSMVLQAVVDADQKFIDICCGEPGSLDDNSVLKRSALYRRAEINFGRLFPSNTFLVGDSAYCASKWLVPPFENYDQLTDQQKSFNYLHSATRKVVERTLALLKGRFTRLNKFTEQQTLSSVRSFIASACVLHNLCIANEDHYIDMNEEGIPDLPSVHNEDPPITTVDRRKILFDYLCQKNII